MQLICLITLTDSGTLFLYPVLQTYIFILSFPNYIYTRIYSIAFISKYDVHIKLHPKTLEKLQLGSGTLYHLHFTQIHISN